MAKKSSRNTAAPKRTLADREAYHKQALEKLQVRKQIAELKKKLK